MRMLIVEDEKDLCNILKKRLQKDYTIDICMDGEIAKDYLNTYTYDNMGYLSSFFAGKWKEQITSYNILLNSWNEKTGLNEDDLLIFLLMCNLGYTCYSGLDLTKHGIHAIPEIFIMFMGVMQLLIDKPGIISIVTNDEYDAGTTIKDRINISSEATRKFISKYYRNSKCCYHN